MGSRIGAGPGHNRAEDFWSCREIFEGGEADLVRLDNTRTYTYRQDQADVYGIVITPLSGD